LNDLYVIISAYWKKKLNGDVGGGFQGIQITSGFFQLWRGAPVSITLIPLIKPNSGNSFFSIRKIRIFISMTANTIQQITEYDTRTKSKIRNPPYVSTLYLLGFDAFLGQIIAIHMDFVIIRSAKPYLATGGATVHSQHMYSLPPYAFLVQDFTTQATILCIHLIRFSLVTPTSRPSLANVVKCNLNKNQQNNELNTSLHLL
jgi:hypothetical protein